MSTDAVMQLFLLVQLNQEGSEETNLIVSKVLDKFHNGRPMDLPSSFVHKSISNARRHIAQGSRWTPTQ